MKRQTSIAFAGLAAAATLGTTMVTPAFAGVGGGDVTGSGGGTGGAADHMLLITEDDYTAAGQNKPVQGWGDDSINYFINEATTQTKYPMATTSSTPANLIQNRIKQACGPAIQEAIARTPGATTARVVQVGVAIGSQSGGGAPYAVRGAVGSDFTKWYNQFWPAAENDLANYPNNTEKQDIHDEFVSHIQDNVKLVCVAINDKEQTPPPATTYPLTVKTEAAATFPTAGGTDPVHDSVTTSTTDPTPNSRYNYTTTLHWIGADGTQKSFAESNNYAALGATSSYQFKPADFGWTVWPSGTYWYGNHFPRQGDMASAYDTPSYGDKNFDPAESWKAAGTPPSKVLFSANATLDQIVSGQAPVLSDTAALASGQMYYAQVSAYGDSNTHMKIYDVINTDKVFIGSDTKDDASKVFAVTPDGKRMDVTATIDRSQAGKVIVSAPFDDTSDNGLQGKYTLVVPTYVQPTLTNYDVPDDSKACYGAAYSTCVNGNSEKTRKITPVPDKVWVLNPAGGLTTADPDRTNTKGADTQTFLPGSSVSAVVNGRVPANLDSNLSNYQINDIVAKSSNYIDWSQAAAGAHVWAQDDSGTYQDVTNEFTIAYNATTGTIGATAKADSEILSTSAKRTKDRDIKLIVSGTFKTDYKTNGEKITLLNEGSEVWNNETVPTNTPPVYTWTPNPHKTVNSSTSQGGDGSDINNHGVWPGQRVTYNVTPDLAVPGDLANGITKVAIEDDYDPIFTPDKGSVKLTDTRNGSKVIDPSNYDVTWDEAANKVTVNFHADWIKANVTGTDKNWLNMSFEGNVKANANPGTVISNTAYELLNDLRVQTETPKITVPGFTPHKEDLNTDLQNIDGKTVMQGDHLVYRLTLDGGPARDTLAYDVHKLGMGDDYDENYLDLNAAGVTVKDKTTGADVTSKFNIQVVNGEAYIFAKTVDTKVGSGDTATTIKGDPQPTDLKAYSAATIDPTKQPGIDQSLLGHQYWVYLNTTVKKSTDGYVIKNQAFQNLENVLKNTEIVSNPLKAIDPTKDVTLDVNGKSINATEVALNSNFNYRLNTSTIPANRAYNAKQWSITDTFKPQFDRYTGQWAVYADTDLYNGQTVVAKKGDKLADSTGYLVKGQTKPLFTATWDDKTATFSVQATDAYFALVNTRNDLAQGWSAYTQMQRIAPSDKVTNVHTESYNGVKRPSNEVWTKTPENVKIDVEKYTLSEGPVKGDRDQQNQALVLTDQQAKDQKHDGLSIGFTVKNLSNVPLQNVKLSDKTFLGSGATTGITCKVPMDSKTAAALNSGSTAKADSMKQVSGDQIGYMAVGASYDCTASLTGILPGDLHGNKATVTGESVFAGSDGKHKQVTDNDDWYGKSPSHPAIAIEKYNTSDGPAKGDRNQPSDALTVGKDGTPITFMITNTGDTALNNVTMSDKTVSGTGSVTGITCTLPGSIVKTDYADASNATNAKARTVKPSQLGTLAVGERVFCTGTLTGVVAGTSHTDTATVTGTPQFSKTPISAKDDWNGKRPAVTPPKGAQTGNAMSEQNREAEVGGIAAVTVGGLAGIGLALRRRMTRKSAK